VTDEDYLQSLYVGLLGRVPDEQGFAHHLAFLRRSSPDPLRYAQLVASFTNSPEFRLTRHFRDIDSLGNFFLPDLSEVIFEHALPIGSFCHAAMALKKAGIRSFSTPFDWLFSCPDMIAQCLSDGFRHFLDPEQYEAVPPEMRHDPGANLCQHRGFKKDFGVSFVFNHHKPYERSDYEYFQRCVQRFKNAVASPGWNLFIHFSPIPVIEDHLGNLMSALRQQAAHFVLLAMHFPVVTCNESSPLDRRIRTKRLKHDLLSMEMEVSAPSNGVMFAHQEDELMLTRILKSFRFSGLARAP
jgi:hypothetical protein